MNFCSNCGHKLVGGEKFCPSCGNTLNGQKTSGQEHASSVQTARAPSINLSLKDKPALAKESSEEIHETKNVKKNSVIKPLVIVAGIVVIILLCISAYGDKANAAPLEGLTYSQEEKAQFKDFFSTMLNDTKQDIYNILFSDELGSGVAKSISIDKFDYQALNDDAVVFRVAYTLFWDGPITTNGRTQVYYEVKTQISSGESEYVVFPKILYTDGHTSGDLVTLGAALLTLL